MNPLADPLPPTVVSTNELVEGWQRSRQTIQRWIREGKLTIVGRRIQNYFDVAQVDDLAKTKGFPPVNKFRETRHPAVGSSTPQK